MPSQGSEVKDREVSRKDSGAEETAYPMVQFSETATALLLGNVCVLQAAQGPPLAKKSSYLNPITSWSESIPQHTNPPHPGVSASLRPWLATGGQSGAHELVQKRRASSPGVQCLAAEPGGKQLARRRGLGAEAHAAPVAGLLRRPGWWAKVGREEVSASGIICSWFNSPSDIPRNGG